MVFGCSYSNRYVRLPNIDACFFFVGVELRYYTASRFAVLLVEEGHDRATDLIMLLEVLSLPYHAATQAMKIIYAGSSDDFWATFASPRLRMVVEKVKP